MIVLTRKRDQSIVLLQDGKVLATVLVVNQRGSYVHLGVDAPKEIVVLRGELRERQLVEEGTT